MGRTKLPEGQKRVNMSFTLTDEDHKLLISHIEPGYRSDWIAKVVSKALRPVRNKANKARYEQG